MIQTESPRGRILDRNGNVLVENVAAWAVTVDRTLDKDTRRESSVSSPRCSRRSTRPSSWHRTSTTCARSPLKPAVVALDVPEPARLAILEHIEDYPGTKRRRADGAALSAGSSSPRRCSATSARSPTSNSRRAATPATKRATTIGQDGAEPAFESELRGKPRRETVEVDPTGQPVGAPLEVDPGTVGNDVKLTIDCELQGAAELALAQGIESARHAAEREHQGQALREPEGARRRGGRARRGRRLGRRDGVSPQLRPESVGRRHQPDRLRRSTTTRAITRCSNRATQGQYAPGLDVQARHLARDDADGIRGLDDYDHRQGLGQARHGPADFKNAGEAAFGPRQPGAGAHRLERHVLLHGRRRLLAHWNTATRSAGSASRQTRASSASVRTTGVELDEADGRVPDPEWKPAFANANYKTKKEKQDNGQLVSGRRHLHRRSVRATSWSRRCSSRTRTPRSRTAARCGSRTSKRRSCTRDGDAAHDVTPQGDPPHQHRPANVRAAMIGRVPGRGRRSEGHRVRGVPGLPARHRFRSRARPEPRRSTRARATRRCSSRSSRRTHRSTSWSRSSKQAGFGAQTAAPIVRRVIEAMNGLPTAAGPGARHGARLMATIPAVSATRRRTRARPVRCGTSTSCCSRCRSRSARSGC